MPVIIAVAGPLSISGFVLMILSVAYASNKRAKVRDSRNYGRSWVRHVIFSCTVLVVVRIMCQIA